MIGLKTGRNAFLRFTVEFRDYTPEEKEYIRLRREGRLLSVLYIHAL